MVCAERLRRRPVKAILAGPTPVHHPRRDTPDANVANISICSVYFEVMLMSNVYSDILTYWYK